MLKYLLVWLWWSLQFFILCPLYYALITIFVPVILLLWDYKTINRSLSRMYIYRIDHGDYYGDIFYYRTWWHYLLGHQPILKKDGYVSKALKSRGLWKYE